MASEPHRSEIDVQMTRVYVAGTFDTKAVELGYVAECLQACGVEPATVDVSLRDVRSEAEVSARDVASRHRAGAGEVFHADRDRALPAMAEAFRRFLSDQGDLAGVIAVCGSTGASIVSPAMRSLPIGTPKLLVSPVISGDVSGYVGSSDLALLHSVADVAGINRLTRVVLANAAHAIAGMVRWQAAGTASRSITVGLTALGVTSQCAHAVAAQLPPDHECVTLAATQAGGEAATDLTCSDLLDGLIDITLSDVGRAVIDGKAGHQRLAAAARSGTPYVGCCGGLDFTIHRGKLPRRSVGRQLVRHTPEVTLIRNDAEECERIGLFLADQVNAMPGPVCLLLPERGLSALDVPGGPFHDPAATESLFSAIGSRFIDGPDHRLVRLPHAINDRPFARHVATAATELVSTGVDRR